MHSLQKFNLDLCLENLLITKNKKIKLRNKDSNINLMDYNKSLDQ